MNDKNVSYAGIETLLCEDFIPFAAEDRFVLIGIHDAPRLAPSPGVGAALSEAIDATEPHLGKLVPVFDIRGIRDMYRDVEEFISAANAHQADDAHLLVCASDMACVRELNLENRAFKILVVRDQPAKTHALDLAEFCGREAYTSGPMREAAYHIYGQVSLAAAEFKERELPDILDRPFGDESDEHACGSFDDEIAYDETTLASGLYSLERGQVEACLKDLSAPGIDRGDLARSFLASVPSIVGRLEREDDLGLVDYSGNVDLFEFYIRASYMQSFLTGLHRHSLLVEFSMQIEGDRLRCVPYHSHAIHGITTARSSQLLVGRPGVIACTTATVLADEISQLERLLNDPSTREHDIQRFFEAHPNFLRGINYKHIYPQLVLQRDDGTRLIPDFILEPYDDEWCDILDIKLPRQKILVGRKDRATLAAGIHKVAAQLREYSAYFEQDKYRRFVRQKYGLRVHRPRLIALVGRDLVQMDSTEVRRAMTAYDGLDVMTFDKLIRHARSRMLI